MRTHTGERIHKCRYCDASFIGSGNLIVHEQGHTGERPHKCDECSATFTIDGDRRRPHGRILPGPAYPRVHEMFHLKIKNRYFRFCKRALRRIGDFNRHERKHPKFSGTLKRRDETKLLKKDNVKNKSDVRTTPISTNSTTHDSTERG